MASIHRRGGYAANEQVIDFMVALHEGATLQGGKYIIEGVIGQGGFGITYLAIQSSLERKVAIKEFFMKELCERDESTSHVTLGTEGSRETVNRFREKFLKEARNIARLNHPNIVRIIDVFEENGTAYYVMEYAENGSLADKVKREGYITEPVATRYILQVAEALDYIHQRKMNHLDVKPANIMLNEKDEAILIDFGVAKQYDAETSEGTTTTSVCISSGYSPAEQYHKKGVQSFSPQSDVYALAATLYKLLTGITPPEAIEVMDTGLPKEELQEVGVSASAIKAIDAAMRSRRMRPQSVSEFLSLLGEGVKSPVAPIVATPIVPATIEGVNEETRMVREAEAGKITQQNDVLRFVVNGVSFEMIRVEAGTFTMGATSEMKDPWNDEKPAHQVTFKRNYYIGKTQVTQALWQAVMGNNPSSFKGDNLPVESVSWDDCQKFISKLNSLTGQNFRLPTEAEWEFAARGGNNSKHYQYSGSNNLDDVAWCHDNSGNQTHPVATKKPNELGIYDMSGNVWEWCSDWYDNYNSSSQTNPTGPNSGSCRVIRGGSWLNLARFCRSSIRSRITPVISFYNLGFRLLLVP